MAMIPGQVDVDPITGVATGAGAAKEVFDNYDSKQDYQGLTGERLAVARQQVADLCNSLAAVLVTYIKTNAEVSTSVSTTISVGAQAAGVTAGPATVPVTGATSGSGSGTVS